jgi:hypothetical protein
VFSRHVDQELAAIHRAAQQPPAPLQAAE